MTRPPLDRPRTAWSRPAACMALFFIGALLAACGGAESGESPAPARPVAPPAPAEEAVPAPPEEPPVPAAVAEEPPAPEPVVVTAGQELGAVRIGMSEAEVLALGLDESEVDPRSRRFGPYVVSFRDGAVRSVSSSMAELQAIRVGERVFSVGEHIHAMRDAFGECVWEEGGGERYRCRGGALRVQTNHTLDPSEYVISVHAD